MLVEFTRVPEILFWIVPDVPPVSPVGSVGAGHEYLVFAGTTSGGVPTPLTGSTLKNCPVQGVVNFGPITAVCPLA